MCCCFFLNLRTRAFHLDVHCNCRTEVIAFSYTAALKFSKTCVAMKFIGDDDTVN